MAQNPNSPKILEDSQITQTSQPEGKVLPDQNRQQISPSGNTMYTAAPVSHTTTARETLVPLYTAESGITYPEAPVEEKKERVTLDLIGTPLEIVVPSVDSLQNQDFAMVRRLGFGGSDSGILCGVNPYTPLQELITQKASVTLTAEEIATGEQVAVMKGHDLEPLVLYKMQKLFNIAVLKPSDMYRYKEHPYLTMNFDGVTGEPGHYIPVEVKIVTAKGERHYNPWSAIYVGGEGFKPLPQNWAITNNSIMTKAEKYGIPPYYYTQLQDQMMALEAPFGYLATLWERTWRLHIYLVHRDGSVGNMLKINGFKAWEKVEALRADNGFYEKDPFAFIGGVTQ